MKTLSLIALVGLLQYSNGIQLTWTGPKRLPGQQGNEKAHAEQDAAESLEEKHNRLDREGYKSEGKEAIDHMNKQVGEVEAKENARIQAIKDKEAWEKREKERKEREAAW